MANANPLILHVQKQNDRIIEEHKKRYERAVDEGEEDTPRTFETYFEQEVKQVLYALPNPADDGQIALLADTSKRELPPSLQQFYRTYGGYGLGLNGANLSVFSPQKLLASLSDDRRPYEKLSGLGLHDMIQFSWENDKTYLKPEGGFEQAGIDIMNKWLCIGMIMDRSCEAYGYFVQTAPDLFGVYCWHQDDQLPDPDEVKGYPLTDLLLRVIEMTFEQDDEGYFTFDTYSMHNRLNS